MKTFKPAWWLPSAHLQTIWPTLTRRQYQLNLSRERIELADGDFVDLDWNGAGTGPIILILHGLEGSAHSHYARGMMQTLARYGWRAVVMHFRSCSGEINRLPRTYHSGDTHDLATVIATIKAREPTTALAAIGYSMGGNVLLKWLGETVDENPLVGAIGVSVPFDLSLSVNRLESGFSRIYARHLLKYLRRKLAAKMQQAAFVLPQTVIPRISSIRQFDDLVTAPLHGFKNAEDYYQQSSSRRYLKRITVPTLLVHAEDDPFMPVQVIPTASELSPAVTLEVYAKGGHVGFIQGNNPFCATYWLEERIPLFLQQFL